MGERVGPLWFRWGGRVRRRLEWGVHKVERVGGLKEMVEDSGMYGSGGPLPLSRSQQMSRILGYDTGPELLLRGALEHLGLRRDSRIKAPAGRPDLCFSDARAAVFVDGCFWHGCPHHYVRPRTRDEFWSAKLIATVERDSRQSNVLAEAGWTVIRVWEHEVLVNLESTAESVARKVYFGDLSTWSTQLRIQRVVEVVPGVERREYALLGEPAVVVEAQEAPRVTAKARMKKH